MLARHRDGHQVPISITARTMPTSDGALRGSVWVLRDITLKRAAEESQAEMTREIATANRELAAITSADTTVALRTIRPS